MKIEIFNNKKKILLIPVVLLLIGIAVILTTSLAKYKVTESIKLASGTINYSPSDLNVMAFYLESDDGYVSSDTIPESGYALNEEESYCKVGNTKQDVTISYDMSSQTLKIVPITIKGTKCYLYFDISLGKDIILANKIVNTRTDFSMVLTTDTTGTIYSAKDDDGDSYYYAGAPTDNWVKFAGFYWRIIRINGDGTIRMIYAGTDSSITTGDNTHIGFSEFNSEYDDNMYVGYMYTSDSVHGLGTSSTIKGVLDTWYTSNLTNYASYIDTNAGFCGDRTPSTSSSSSNGSGGTGNDITYYGAYIRLFTNKNPSLKCTNSSDLYTTSESSKGNKVLTYPIGLITADEAAYAGGVVGTSNTSYYLYIAQIYWTMSPSHHRDVTMYQSLNFNVYYDGSLYNDSTSAFVVSEMDVRPVINLRADVILSGSGTTGNPYTVS